jgi:hypothetical protein
MTKRNVIVILCAALMALVATPQAYRQLRNFKKAAQEQLTITLLTVALNVSIETGKRETEAARNIAVQPAPPVSEASVVAASWPVNVEPKSAATPNRFHSARKKNAVGPRLEIGDPVTVSKVARQWLDIARFEPQMVRHAIPSAARMAQAFTGLDVTVQEKRLAEIDKSRARFKKSVIPVEVEINSPAFETINLAAPAEPFNSPRRTEHKTASDAMKRDGDQCKIKQGKTHLADLTMMDLESAAAASPAFKNLPREAQGLVKRAGMRLRVAAGASQVPRLMWEPAAGTE